MTTTEPLPAGYRQIFENLRHDLQIVKETSLDRQPPDFIERFAHHYLMALSALSQIRATARWHHALPTCQKLLVAVNVHLYPEEKATWRRFWHGLWVGYPAALWQSRGYHLASLLIVLISAGIGYLVVVQNFEMVSMFIPPAISSSHGVEMEAYLFSKEAQKSLLTHGRDMDVMTKSAFSTFLMINNISVALRCFAFGVLFGLPTLIILAQTGLMLGALPALFSTGDAAGIWAWLLPHGVPEVGAIILSGGAGLELGVSMLRPGEAGMAASLKKTVRQVGGTVGVFVLCLIWAGWVESFIRQSTLTNPVRFAIAAASLLPFLLLFVRAYVAHHTLCTAKAALQVPQPVRA